MNEEILRKYINEFRNLRIDRAHGDAPHQPVLLLTIIEMIEQEQIKINKIPPSPHLVEKFLKYWNCITNRKPNPTLPFFHLKSRSFWHHHPNPGYEKALEVVSQIKTFPQLRKMISHASLDEELFTLLIQPLEREILRKTLIDKYFLGLTNEIQSVISEEQQISGFSKELLDYVQHDFSTELEEPIESEKKIREPGFRRTIMRIYDYTCAVCKLQILTLNGESVTEAAHIIPFNRSNNDDVRNGISLCKLHHWAFDRYLFSVDESYIITVSDLMTEKGPTEWKLTTLNGKGILLPKLEELYPAQEALAWHREKMLSQ
ncbi:MAG: HNH endonuclease [Candidatus Poribacteria bacterium]|nr:HNH endonuclease [Candidatus Poribacteria bacterium]